jgi:hypothetical protein
MAAPDQGSVVLLAKGSLLYGVRGKLPPQILCGVDDDPR